MSKKGYICPVCGFDGLNEPPYAEQGEPSYEICLCCGFEFGFDESEQKDKHISFRQKWIESGANWFAPENMPSNWNLEEQLRNIFKDKFGSLP